MSPGRMVAIDFRTDDCEIEASNLKEAIFNGWTSPDKTAITGVTILPNDSLTRAQVDNALSAADISYVTGVGHGLNNEFPGNDAAPVFAIGFNTTTLDPNTTKASVEGRIIHLLSCQSADPLGQALVDPSFGEAAAFFGYDENFTWPVGGESADQNVFFDCDAEIDRQLVTGATADDTYKAVMSKYGAAIAAFTAANKTQLAAMLTNNMNALNCPSTGSLWGDKSAKLT